MTSAFFSGPPRSASTTAVLFAVSRTRPDPLRRPAPALRERRARTLWLRLVLCHSLLVLPAPLAAPPSRLLRRPLSRPAARMAQAHKRLQRELQALQRESPPGIHAVPLEADILQWHYVIEGPPGTPYAGGFYHGLVRFPSEYPFKPPSVMVYTPSGRFATNTRICLSMSDFHP